MKDMLEVDFDHRVMDLNGLKWYVCDFGRSKFYEAYNSIFFCAHLEGDVWRLTALLGKLEQNKDSYTPEEIEWISKLNGLVEHLGYMRASLSAEKYVGEEVEMELISGLADRLEGLVSGYVNLRDPDCPACPNHNKDASWEGWREKISPRAWLRRVSNEHWERSEKGVWYPSGLIKDDEKK